MNAKIIIRKLFKTYPLKISKKYHDFSGYMLGNREKEVKRIALMLDLDDISYDLIKDSQIDMIITHHPFLYGKKSEVLLHDENKRNLFQKLVENDILVYSFHTNFDEGEGGINDGLAKLLELENIHVPESTLMARAGSLKQEMSFEDFTKYVLNKFNLNYLVGLNYGKSTIKSVAIVGGGGWSDCFTLNDNGYDVFISGDVPHHGRRAMILNHCNYLDCSHEIENIFMNQMEIQLKNIAQTLDIIKIYHEEQASIYLREDK